jgi:hypothetical protein
MPVNPPYGVVGSDGSVPIYDPDAPWRQWALHEIWQGPDNTGTKHYVPKVLDYVKDTEVNQDYIVDDLELTTLTPTLRPINPNNTSYVLDQPDVLFGVGPGTQADTYRVYLDDSVTPHVLAVDSRLKVGGTMCSYAKIFKGANTGPTGEVISAMYNASGYFVTENVPLELVAIDSHINYSIKVVGVCYTMETLADAEVVTVVFYNDAGHVVSKRQCLVENTGFIRSINEPQVFITQISLESPFLSATVDRLIEFPINVPISALNLTGVVHYSDGSTQRLPVDGNKFKLLGLEQFIATTENFQIDLVLRYVLSPDEVTYSATTNGGKYMTEVYSIVTVNPNNSYSVKLFGYPEWVDNASGYNLRWFLFNLDRNLYFDVTPHVLFAQNTGPYNPIAYGYLQQKAITLNLQAVSGAFKPYIHTQLYDVVLNGPPTPDTAPWTVAHEHNPSRPLYGVGLFAKRNAQDATQVKIDCGFTLQEDWITHLYKHTFPLVDPYTETQVLIPNQFEVIYGATKVLLPIAAWTNPVALGVPIPLGATIYLRFLQVVGQTEINLAMAALCVVEEA